MVSGMASSIPSWANHMIQVPANELPASDKKEIGLSSVAKMDTEVTHHGTVPSLLKYSLPFISFLEKCRPANRTAAK